MTRNASQSALAGGAPVCQSPLQPPSWPPVSASTAERLKAVYLSGQWSFNSPAEQTFARAFASHHDARHGVFMANGTATLECALQACGVGRGDEVIVPALTWPATAMAVHYVGATPVFVDVEPSTLCLDPARVAEAINGKTAAIIPVHLYGSMADLEALLALSQRHGLVLIEDCAHMHGGKWNGRGVGSWGQVGSFSFQQSKTLASGEGGICLTQDDQLADRIFRLKHIGYPDGSVQGRAASGPPEGLVCHNYRSTAFEATILTDQLQELSARIDQYNTNRDVIESYLSGIPGVRLQSRGRLADPQGYYCLVVIFDGAPMVEIPRERIHQALVAEGLTMLPSYGPVYRHMLYNMPAHSYRIAGDNCPMAETIGTDRAFNLVHNWLMSEPATIRAIGQIIAKVAAHADQLQALDSPRGARAGSESR